MTATNRRRRIFYFVGGNMRTLVTACPMLPGYANRQLMQHPENTHDDAALLKRKIPVITLKKTQDNTQDAAVCFAMLHINTGIHD